VVQRSEVNIIETTNYLSMIVTIGPSDGSKSFDIITHRRVMPYVCTHARCSSTSGTVSSIVPFLFCWMPSVVISVENGPKKIVRAAAPITVVDRTYIDLLTQSGRVCIVRNRLCSHHYTTENNGWYLNGCNCNLYHCQPVSSAQCKTADSNYCSIFLH
jgi:hypothetical protein